jgi:hypothetical protein
MKSIFYLF